jgi:dipeptidyl aminopeptidase/acylaminoacyl peptidase
LAKVSLTDGEVTPLFRDAIKLPAGGRMSQQSRDGHRMAFVNSSVDRPEDIWLAEGDFRQLRKLSDLNPGLSAMTLGKSRVIEFKSRDGKPLRASVLLPANYEPGRRYPTLFWVYASDTGAGSHANDFGLVGFGQFNLQILAANGYAVVWPEIPTRVGMPVRDLLSAVSGAVERVTELGIADRQRLAVMGNSNGGYSTLALLTQTDMFKLGVMNAGFGDLTAFYGTFGGGWVGWLEQQGGNMGVPPWEAPLRYVENSPIYYLDRVNAPLIIQAGTADSGIINHSDAVWVGMKRLGKDVTYLRYEGEGHALTSAANIRDYWSRVLPALDKYIGAASGSE